MGVDDDCDGAADLADSSCNTFSDDDGDGYCEGSPCLTSLVMILGIGDCDDNDPNTYPGAPEICDGVHNAADCDTGSQTTPANEVDDDGDDYVDC